MKKTILFLFFILLFVGITTKNNFGQDVKEQSDKKKFLTAVQFLEENPLDETAQETRKWALRYSQDIDNPFCEKLSFIFFAQEVRGEIMSQYLMKSAAFHLEQNGEKYDINDAQLAALTSALNVYEKILENDASAKYKKFDDLVILKNKNQLIKTVKSAKCK